LEFFVVCAFVFHNYVNLGVGLKLTLGQEVRILSGWPASHLAANLTSPSLSNFGKVDLRVGILPGSVWDLWRTGVLEALSGNRFKFLSALMLVMWIDQGELASTFLHATSSSTSSNPLSNPKKILTSFRDSPKAEY